MVSGAAEAERTESSADARPQYTRTSATASSSSPGVLLCGQGLMFPGNRSVTPVHSSRDLADYRPPAETRLLCPDFLQSATTEETAHTAVLRGTERLVEVIQRGAGRQRQDHRLEPECVPEVPGHLTGGDEQGQIPGVVAAAQVLHHEVEFVALLRQGVDVARLY